MKPFDLNVIGIPRRLRGHERDLLAKHGKLVLVCWCAPKPCHAEIIRDALLAERAGT